MEVVCGWMVVQTSFGHEGMREKENYLGRVFCVVVHSCTCTQECCLSCFSRSVLMIECDNIRDSYPFFRGVTDLQFVLHPEPNQALSCMQCPCGHATRYSVLFCCFLLDKKTLHNILSRLLNSVESSKEFSGVLLQIESRS